MGVLESGGVQVLPGEQVSGTPQQNIISNISV